MKVYKEGVFVIVERNNSAKSIPYQSYEVIDTPNSDELAVFDLNNKVKYSERYQDITDKQGLPLGGTKEAVKSVILTLFTDDIAFGSDPIYPLMINQDEILEDDIDWDLSEFPNWVGNPKDMFRNVQVNEGIYNDSVDNPKTFTLRLKRTRHMRVFGIGTGIGDFSNIKVTILGSGDTLRGILDLSEDPAKLTSSAYSQEQFVINSLLVEFYTDDKVDVTNIFVKNEFSTRKQGVVHKWGINSDIDVGAEETVWSLSDLYIYTVTPQNYYISSSSVADTGKVEVETVGVNADGRLVRERTEFNLQGQASFVVPTNFICSAHNRSFAVDTELVGDIYIYENTATINGVPTDLSKVRGHIPAGKQQTEQAVYTVPEFLEDGRKVVFMELYEWSASALRRNGATGTFQFMIREPEEVLRERDLDILSDDIKSGKIWGENTPLEVPAGSDIEVRCNVEQNDVGVKADFRGVLITL